MAERKRDFKKEISDVSSRFKVIDSRIKNAREDLETAEKEQKALESEYDKMVKIGQEKINSREGSSEKEQQALDDTYADVKRGEDILRQRREALERLEAERMTAKRKMYDLQGQTIGPFARIAQWFRQKVEELVYRITAPAAIKEFQKLSPEEQERATRMAVLEAEEKLTKESVEKDITSVMKESIHEDPGYKVKGFDSKTVDEKDMVVFEKLTQLSANQKEKIYDGIGQNHVICFDYRKDAFDDRKGFVVVSVVNPVKDAENQYSLHPLKSLGSLQLQNGEFARIPVTNGKLEWNDAARNVVERVLRIERSTMEDLAKEGEIVKSPIHTMDQELKTVVSSITQTEYSKKLQDIENEMSKLKQQPVKTQVKDINEKTPEREPRQDIDIPSPKGFTIPVPDKDTLADVLKSLHEQQQQHPNEKQEAEIEGYTISITPPKTKGKDPAIRIDERFVGFDKEGQSLDDLAAKLVGTPGHSYFENIVNKRDREGNYLVDDSKLTNKYFAHAIIFDIRHDQDTVSERLQEALAKELPGISLDGIREEINEQTKDLKDENLLSFENQRDAYFEAHADGPIAELAGQKESPVLDFGEQDIPDPFSGIGDNTIDDSQPLGPAEEYLREEPVMESPQDSGRMEAEDKAPEQVKTEPEKEEYVQEDIHAESPHEPERQQDPQEAVQAEPAKAQETIHRNRPDVTPELENKIRTAVQELHDEYKHMPNNQAKKHIIEREVEGYKIAIHPKDKQHTLNGREYPYYTVDNRFSGIYLTSRKNIDITTDKILGRDDGIGTIGNKINDRNDSGYLIADEDLTARKWAQGAEFDLKRAIVDKDQITTGFNDRAAAFTAEGKNEIQYEEVSKELTSILQEKYPDTPSFVEHQLLPVMEQIDGPLRDVLSDSITQIKDLYIDQHRDDIHVVSELHQEDIGRIDDEGRLRDTDDLILVPAATDDFYITEDNYFEFGENIDLSQYEQAGELDMYTAIPGREDTQFDQVEKGVLLNEGSPLIKPNGEYYTLDDIQDPGTKTFWTEYAEQAELSDTSYLPDTREPEVYDQPLIDLDPHGLDPVTAYQAIEEDFRDYIGNSDEEYTL